MMQPDHADPAAPERGGVRIYSEVDTGTGALAGLARRWWWMVLGAAVGLIAGAIFLGVVTPRYTVAALLMAERTGAPSPNDPPMGEFLAAQQKALLAPGVQTPQVKAFDPEIGIESREDLITIKIETDRPREAAVALSTMVNTYLKTAGNQPAAVAQKLSTLAAERDKLAADRDAKFKALTDFRAQTNVSGTSADAVVHARREQLAQTLAGSQKQLEQAKADAAAAANLPTDPEKLAAFIQSARAKGAFKALDERQELLKKQIDDYETKLETHKQTLLAQHPLIVQTQKNLDRAKVQLAAMENDYPQAYRDYCARQLADAERRVAEFKDLLAQQTQRTEQTTSAAPKAAELEAAVKEADAKLAEADKKIREATVSNEGGVRVNLVMAPKAPQRPSYPDRSKVLAWSGAIGLLAGLAIALAGRR